MAAIYAQHAQAGEYHLETRYCEPERWEWFVLKNDKRTAEFSGDARTLKGAMQSAAMCIGLYPENANWEPIGPPIKIPAGQQFR